MIISHLLCTSPWKLSKWSETSHWASALKLWGYRGNPALEGDEFHRQLGLGIMRRSLKKAGYLWRRLFLGKPIGALRDVLTDDNGDILTDGRGEILKGTRKDSPPNYEVD